MATTNRTGSEGARRAFPRAAGWQPEHLEPRRLFSSPGGNEVPPEAPQDGTAIAPAGDLAVPVLNSFPSTARTLYLDFDGDNTRQWHGWDPGPTPPYDEDGDPADFSDTELEGIREIWARVAEKFSPFRLNVTTVDPGPLVDGVHGRIVVGGEGNWHDTGADGGTSLTDGFFDLTLSNTGWVFPLALGNRKAVAEGVAHEAGHLFGLEHQSLYGVSGDFKLAEYHPGDGTRAPVMGDSSGAPRGVWWNGKTGTAPNVVPQNDLFILENKLDYRVDDHSDFATGATPLVVTGTGSLAGAGVIARGTATVFDRDVFSFPFSGGDLKFTVSPARYGGMLDATVSIYRQGVLFGRSDTAALEETLVVENASSGLYTVVVEGNVVGDVGQYTVTGVLDDSWDNSLATAVRVGGDLIERPFTGWRSFHDPYIGTNDPDDFYRFVTDAAPSVFTAELYNVAADVRMYLIRDDDHDGRIDGDETVASSSQTSATSELISNVPLAADTVYYVNIRRFGGQSSYDLNLFTDYARNSLGAARLTGSRPVWTGRGSPGVGPLPGEFVATDFVDGGDRDDFYRVRLDAAAVL
ncbi:MAG TPA: hypothetical protein VFB66_12120, partial [Tepidisphaeraceae bacterium]|nr:hypothetical protein [Tepidisphaeraceae bacterium]